MNLISFWLTWMLILMREKWWCERDYCWTFTQFNSSSVAAYVSCCPITRSEVRWHRRSKISIQWFQFSTDSRSHRQTWMADQKAVTRSCWSVVWDVEFREKSSDGKSESSLERSLDWRIHKRKKVDRFFGPKQFVTHRWRAPPQHDERRACDGMAQFVPSCSTHFDVGKVFAFSRRKDVNALLFGDRRICYPATLNDYSCLTKHDKSESTSNGMYEDWSKLIIRRAWSFIASNDNFGNGWNGDWWNPSKLLEGRVKLIVVRTSIIRSQQLPRKVQAPRSERNLPVISSPFSFDMEVLGVATRVSRACTSH